MVWIDAARLTCRDAEALVAGLGSSQGVYVTLGYIANIDVHASRLSRILI